jgi:hypothetical protein
MVYLIHFSKRYPGGKQPQHYVGYADDEKFEQRQERHKKGGGSRLLRAVNFAGIDYQVVRTWAGGRNEERRLKDQHHHERYCPICSRESFENLKKSTEKNELDGGVNIPRRRVIGYKSIYLNPKRTRVFGKK